MEGLVPIQVKGQVLALHTKFRHAPGDLRQHPARRVD